MSVCGYKKTEGDEPYVDEKQLASVFYKSEDFYCEKNVNAVIAVCKLYKKSDFKDIRYPVGRLHEDEFATYKILFKYENIAYVDQPLYFYYQNEKSITQSKWSTKKLVSIEALESQVKFFLNNDYKFALKNCLRNLTLNIMMHLTVIKNCNDKCIQKEYLPKLKRELRRTFRLANINSIHYLLQQFYFLFLLYYQLFC